MASNTYYFGIEMEMVVKPHPKRRDQKKWAKASRSAKGDNAELLRLYETLAKALGKDNIPCKVIDKVRRPDAGAGTDSWLVMTDTSIIASKDWYPMEVVSRKLGSTERWRDEFEKVWRVIDDNFEVNTNDSCGTHVHLSPWFGWSLKQVRKLSKSVFFWEAEMGQYMPPERMIYKYCLFNADASKDPKLHSVYTAAKDKDFRTIYEWIDRFGTERELAQALSQGREVAWNFRNLLGGTGSVEFRRAPQVKTARDAVNWASFVITFVHRALEKVPFAASHPGDGQFWKQLQIGARELGDDVKLPEDPAELRGNKANVTITDQENE
ncbi:MAG: hypothetical protein M1817_000614 [Caeruleum heppii]|nr:MAG: hypothetical protein M1817_000614 [Caeruleum heppii]